MVKAETKSWDERWALVNAVTRRGIQALPMDEKFRQTGELMAWGHSWGMVRPSPNTITETRARWLRLKAAAGTPRAGQPPPAPKPYR